MPFNLHSVCSARCSTYFVLSIERLEKAWTSGTNPCVRFAPHHSSLRRTQIGSRSSLFVSLNHSYWKMKASCHETATATVVAPRCPPRPRRVGQSWIRRMRRFISACQCVAIGHLAIIIFAGAKIMRAWNEGCGINLAIPF